MWSPKFRDTWLNLIDSQYPYFYVNDCLVDPESGLVFKDNDIVWQASNENLIWMSKKSNSDYIEGDKRWKDRINRFSLISERMEYLRVNFLAKLERVDIFTVESDHCLHLLHPFGRYVPGHMFDTLQKISVTESNNILYDTCILSNPKEITDFDSHLNILGLGGVNNFYGSPGTLLKVKNLIFINPVSYPTTFTIESFTFLRKRYFNYFDINELENLTNKKNQIFLTRRKGKFNRNLTNEHEIERTLEDLGVRVVDGSETFSELVRLFSSSTHISGIHGSLFMNTIFGNKDAKYLEYCPKSRVVKTFHDAYKICNSYDFRLAESDSSHNVTINPSELVEFYSN